MNPQPCRQFYLSFADDSSGGFRGACVVVAASALEAVMRAHTLGINPGGQVLMGEWDESRAGKCPFPLDRLLSLDELKRLDPSVKSIRELEDEAAR